ncbi:MAG: hypothetical protein QXF57_01610, partial [Acidilobaceae archaeon]
EFDIALYDALLVFILLAAPYYSIVVVHIHLELPLAILAIVASTAGLLLASADEKESPLAPRVARQAALSSMWAIVVATSLNRPHVALSTTLAILLTLALVISKPDRRVLSARLASYIKLVKGPLRALRSLAFTLQHIDLSKAVTLLAHVIQNVDPARALAVWGFSAMTSTVMAIVVFFERGLGEVVRASRIIEESLRAPYGLLGSAFARLPPLLESYVRAELGHHVIAIAFVALALMLGVLLAVR